MKYADAWDELKKRLEADANASGEMMSLREWVHGRAAASQYLRLMYELEEEYG